MKATPADESSRLLVAYYAATALFLVLDYGFKINLRLAFLDGYPLWRGVYYGICFACLALILWRPALTEIVGAIESLLTLVALILNMALRTMVVTDEMIASGHGLVTMPEIINFLMSGGIAYYAWSRGIKAMQNRP
jgi:hypothetical protein